MVYRLMATFNPSLQVLQQELIDHVGFPIQALIHDFRVIDWHVLDYKEHPILVKIAIWLLTASSG